MKKQLPKRKLTLKQRRFVAEYIKHGNATKSAMIAYPDQSSMSQQQQGSDNLKKPLIQEAIEQALLKHELTPEKAVYEIGTIASQPLNSLNQSVKLKANEMVLELHGWRKQTAPNAVLNVKNGFFTASRD